jgi:RNA polymerase sigma factor (sigma-70 family)
MHADEASLRQLMTGSLTGDSAAHGALLRALLPVLRRYFGRKLGTDDVEDLVQDTLIAVHTKRASYDPARPFAPWMFAVARYKLIDSLRRKRPTVSLDGLDDILGDTGFEDSASAKLDVATLLGELPLKQADAIRNTRIEGFSTSEAAARAGISESDVKVSVHRGLKAVARRLGRE